MEVTLRMIVAFALLVIMALLAGSLANDQTGKVSEVSDSQTSYAECQLWKSRIGNSPDGKWEKKYYDNDCDSGSSTSSDGPNDGRGREADPNY